MAQSQAWKNHERFIAKAFDGERCKRGADFGESMPDVIAPVGNFLHTSIDGLLQMVVECKYSKNQPIVDLVTKERCTVIIQKGLPLDEAFICLTLTVLDVDPFGGLVLGLRSNFTRHIREVLRSIKDVPDIDEWKLLNKWVSKRAGSYLETYLEQAEKYCSTTNAALPIVALAKKSCSYRVLYTKVKYLREIVSLT